MSNELLSSFGLPLPALFDRRMEYMLFVMYTHRTCIDMHLNIGPMHFAVTRSMILRVNKLDERSIDVQQGGVFLRELGVLLIYMYM